MLYITTSILGVTKQYRWYVGQKVPIPHECLPYVSEVQADSHELDRIEHHFSNLPFCKSRVIRWYGDHARFIVGNL
jgi:hypothetical protein